MIDASLAGTGLTCPGCAVPMAQLPFDGHYGVSIDLDVCDGCRGLWFDRRENLRLTPGAILQLFERMHGEPAAARSPLPARMSCPRCRMRLRETHDRQRNTSFRYWRCGHGHGRFITFFDFLREKDFVRPLAPEQLAALRAQVRSVNCSNCGAPVDLQRASACGYCRAPLSMIDFAHVKRMLADLARAEAVRTDPAPAVDPTLVLALTRERRQVESYFSQLERRPDWSSLGSGAGLVEVGIGAVVGLLRRLR